MTSIPVKPVNFSSAKDIKLPGQDLAIIVVDETCINDGKIKSTLLKSLDEKFFGTISQLLACKDFEGKWLQSTSTLTMNDKLPKKLVLIGAGKKATYHAARSRHLGLKAGEVTGALKAEKVVIYSCSALLEKKEDYTQFRVGFSLETYKYPNSNLSDAAKNDLKKKISVTVVTGIAGCDEALKIGDTLSESLILCRSLQDAPPNIATPQFISSAFVTEAKKVGLTVKVFGKKKLEELGFGAMLAVAGGSSFEPQFVIIEHKPKKFKTTLALVGKGLTMDTGGYSIKTPSTSQESMKYDMSGAAVCLSSILAIAKLNLPIHVFAVGAFCENMIDSTSYRVGDVLTSYSGKTIEILNTDAEGRVVLADALAYTAQELKPDFMVEFSTLTGAMVTTFGHIGAGFFPFHDKLKKTIETAMESTGERGYALPVWEEASEDIKGTISDVVNIGATRGAQGSMVGAAFLKEFTGDVPFAHIDIAGVSNNNKAIGYPRKISSGYGVQLSVEIARVLSKES